MNRMFYVNNRLDEGIYRHQTTIQVRKGINWQRFACFGMGDPAGGWESDVWRGISAVSWVESAVS